MVGVGGRSRGCKTCRRRRVKCDETKPTCERCRKGGFHCDGYAQYGEFVDLTKRLTKNGTSKQNTPSPTSSSTDSSITQRPITEAPLLPLIRNPTWDEQSVFATHLVDRLFTWHENPSSPESAAWISVLLKANEDDGVLSFTSIRALATTYFAKTHSQSSLMRKGAGFYSRALSALRLQLQDPFLALQDDILVAIVCMAMYELVTFHQPTGWLHHYRGLAQLTAFRGPQRHQSGIGFAMLPMLRSCIVIGYLIERKHCFLGTPEWKTIPWAKVGLNAKLPLDKLHDMLCDIPGYLEEIDLLGKRTQEMPKKNESLAAFRKKLFASLDTLYNWRWEWEKDFPGSTYTISPKGLDPETSRPLPPSPFQSVIWFSNPYRANELMTYNVVRLLLTRLLELAGVNIDNPESPDFSDPLLPMEGTRHDVAIEICRMVDYHLHCFRRSSGAFMLIFPLNVAYLHLDGDRDGAKCWLETTMAIVADRHGFEVGRRENMPRQIQNVRVV